MSFTVELEAAARGEPPKLEIGPVNTLYDGLRKLAIFVAVVGVGSCGGIVYLLGHWNHLW